MLLCKLKTMPQVNATHTFMAGGYLKPSGLSDAYLYDWTRNVWTPLPASLTNIDSHACALYQDGQGGEFVIMAGNNCTNC
jgi:hypothetical protein